MKRNTQESIEYTHCLVVFDDEDTGGVYKKSDCRKVVGDKCQIKFDNKDYHGTYQGTILYRNTKEECFSYGYSNGILLQQPTPKKRSTKTSLARANNNNKENRVEVIEPQNKKLKSSDIHEGSNIHKNLLEAVTLNDNLIEIDSALDEYSKSPTLVTQSNKNKGRNNNKNNTFTKNNQIVNSSNQLHNTNINNLNTKGSSTHKQSNTFNNSTYEKTSTKSTNNSNKAMPSTHKQSNPALTNNNNTGTQFQNTLRHSAMHKQSNLTESNVNLAYKSTQKINLNNSSNRFTPNKQSNSDSSSTSITFRQMNDLLEKQSELLTKNFDQKLKKFKKSLKPKGPEKLVQL
jgi:hypothetical protein